MCSLVPDFSWLRVAQSRSWKRDALPSVSCWFGSFFFFFSFLHGGGGWIFLNQFFSQKYYVTYDLNCIFKCSYIYLLEIIIPNTVGGRKIHKLLNLKICTIRCPFKKYKRVLCVCLIKQAWFLSLESSISSFRRKYPYYNVCTLKFSVQAFLLYQQTR